MYYIDYKWDLYPDKIVLDNEINVDKLDWKNGDIFQLINIDSKVMLVKIDPIVAFVQGYNINRE